MARQEEQSDGKRFKNVQLKHTGIFFLRCVGVLPVLRVWCGHGSGYITHLEWYAPPVALQRQGGLGGRAGRVR